MAILITGGSKGLGRSIALAFAEQGAEVFLNYHQDDSAAESTATAVTEAGGTPHTIRGDAGSPSGAAEIIAAVSEHTDHLDQVVHCAVDPLAEPVLTVDPDRFTQAVTLNGLGLLYLVQAALPLMGTGGSVFFLSSRGSNSVVPNYAALGTSKALGESLIRYLAKELAPRGIRANTVSAGPLDTDAIRAVLPDAEERLAAAAAANPSGRGLEFTDVSHTVRWLASPEAAMVQGQVVFVDGGLYL